ncbi:MAG: hypothetical protein U1D67_00455, partial [Dehalococcoidia bacterium]|nr:hypothetical protein [Dehalococcoidia bacterium]
MKKYLFILMALVIVLGSALVFTQAKAAQQAPAPNLVVYPPISDLNSKTTIAILGSGFTPHNEYNIMFHDGFGSIGALEETVVADERGNFIAGWALGRYTRGGILWDGST